MQKSMSDMESSVSNDSSSPSRKLWWSPKRNRIEIPSENLTPTKARPKVDSFSNIKYQPGGGNVMMRQESVKWEATPKVGSLTNLNWAPQPSRVSIQQEKLIWKAQPKVNSLDNTSYKPLTKSVQIHNEKLDFTHVTPRVDCGFSD